MVRGLVVRVGVRIDIWDKNGGGVEMMVGVGWQEGRGLTARACYLQQGTW